MKKISILLLIFFSTFYVFSQTNDCGTIINKTFDGTGALPTDWVEYNTSGRITLDSDRLKFNHNATQPSAYTTFTPTLENSFFSFDVSATRAALNCQIHLISSAGKHLSSIGLGLGNAKIKFATSMNEEIPSDFTEGNPSVSFPANTSFKISTQIDFTTKTVSFYIDGNLVKKDVPFLEEAKDIAKIDIQSIYMYSDNGQVYFDNMTLLNGEENRLQLTDNITNLESLLAEASIGDKFHQYPQFAVDMFQTAINTAKDVLNDCEAASELINSTIIELKTAQETFEASKVNNPVLKIYNQINLTGQEHEIYPGYYNGTLGTYDDWAVSFTLEKGYMVTFAENVNGTGASKIYVAAEKDLKINLPENLQKIVSFIRLGPWFDVHKKGMAGKGTDVIQEYDNS
ncbi:MAG: hypothetical protein ABJG40_13995, partial [Polaribacter sp.]